MDQKETNFEQSKKAEGISYPRPELSPLDLIGALKMLISDANVEQNFIFVSGKTRIEYHYLQQTFVIEERTFDTVKFNEDEDE